MNRHEKTSTAAEVNNFRLPPRSKWKTPPLVTVRCPVFQVTESNHQKKTQRESEPVVASPSKWSYSRRCTETL